MLAPGGSERTEMRVAILTGLAACLAILLTGCDGVAVTSPDSPADPPEQAMAWDESSWDDSTWQ